MTATNLNTFEFTYQVTTDFDTYEQETRKATGVKVNAKQAQILSLLSIEQNDLNNKFLTASSSLPFKEKMLLAQQVADSTVSFYSEILQHIINPSTGVPYTVEEALAYLDDELQVETTALVSGYINALFVKKKSHG